MPKIAVFGGTSYLASLIKNLNNIRNNEYVFFSRKKTDKNYINYLSKNKNLNIFKNFDFAIHLVGPNQNQLKRNINLIKKKNLITSQICNLCLENNIKLIYLSSMQVYKDYGKNNISINSKINLKNSYSKSHYQSEKIIIKKFLGKKKMFTILRVGNVFGFKKYKNLREIKDNLIHNLCYSAVERKKIFIQKGNIQRTFIPSHIFVKTINLIIKKKLFGNSVVNISYKNLYLKEIADIIQKRIKLSLNVYINIKIKFSEYKNKFLINQNHNLKFKPLNKIIYKEIDQILNFLLKNT